MDIKELKKARKLGITPGRLLIQEEALKNGVHITDSELRSEKIFNLEKDKNFKTADLIKNAVTNKVSLNNQDPVVTDDNERNPKNSSETGTKKTTNTGKRNNKGLIYKEPGNKKQKDSNKDQRELRNTLLKTKTSVMTRLTIV